MGLERDALPRPAPRLPERGRHPEPARPLPRLEEGARRRGGGAPPWPLEAERRRGDGDAGPPAQPLAEDEVREVGRLPGLRRSRLRVNAALHTAAGSSLPASIALLA